MNIFKRLMMLTALCLILAVGLAACGGGEETPPEPTQAADTGSDSSAAADTAVPPTDVPPTDVPPTDVPPTNTPEPEPTDTPAPTNTPEPTAEPAPSLGEISSDVIGVTIGYPEGWDAEVDETNGDIRIATDAALFDTPEDIGEGMMIQVTSLPGEILAFMLTGEQDASNPVDVLDMFVSLVAEFGEEDGDTAFTEREASSAASIAGYDAATAMYDVSSTELDGVAQFIAIADPEHDRVAFLFAATPLESEKEYLSIFEDMLGSISLSAPEEVDLGELGGGIVSPELGESLGLLLYGDVVANSLAADAIDSWDFIGLEGEVIDIVVKPSGDLDVVIDVLGADGVSVIGGELDDEFETETIEGLALPTTGDYIIVIRGFAGSVGDYELTIAETGTAVIPDEDTTATGDGDLSLGETGTGAFTDGTETISWTFSGSSGDLVDIFVTPLDEDLDVVVDILDSSGISLLDEPTDASYDAEYVPLVFLPEDGLYEIVITSFNGIPGNYEVDVKLANNGETNSLIFASDSLEETDEEHAFPFTGLAGDSVLGVVEPLALEFDVVVGVYNDDTDELLEEVDATTGIETMTFIVPEDGNYYFNISSFEGSVGDYDVALAGPASVIFELAAGDTVFGRFDESNVLEYWLGGQAGDSYVISAEPDAETDMVIRILDLDNNVLLEVDDAFDGETETVTYSFETDDLVVVEISDFWEGQGEFTLTVDFE